MSISLEKDALSAMDMKQFDARCREAVGQYEALAPFLPFTSPAGVAFTREWRDAGCRALREQSFTVAVCGQIKAGKSTLLNALFFEEDLIPEADTPLTAAITLIRHTDGEPYFEVEWYSREEWAENEKALKEKAGSAERVLAGSDEEAKKEARAAQKAIKDREEEVAAMRGKGANPEALLGGAPKRVTPLSRAELEKYVSPVKRGAGVYTPVVRHVTIHANNPQLDRLTVVDTPGTNDTNVARSNVTLGWINKADAVIFLTYAGRAFDQKDWNFINEFLIGIRPDCLFLVINKADALKDAGVLHAQEAYIRNEILDNDEVKKREGFISAATPHAFLSALLERLEQKAKKGALSEDDEWYYEEFSKKLSADTRGTLRENFVKFRADLEEKLIKNSGALMLATQARKIESAWEAARDAASVERESCLQIIGDTEKSLGELEKKQSEIQGVLDGVDALGKECAQEIERVTKETLNRIDEIMAGAKGSLDRELHHRVNVCQTREDIKGSLPWDLKKIISQGQTKALRDIASPLHELEETFKKQISWTEDELRRRGIRGLGAVKTSCEANVKAVFDDITRSAASSLNQNVFASMYESNKSRFLGFLWEIWEKDTVQTCRIRINSLVDQLLAQLDEPVNALRSQIAREGSAVTREFGNAFRSAVQRRKDEVDVTVRDMKSGQANLEKKRGDTRARLEKAEERLGRISAGAAAFARWMQGLGAA